MRIRRFAGLPALLLGCVGSALLLVSWISTPAFAVVKSDDFNGDPFDYGGEPTNADGTFSGGPVGIWDGSFNMANLAGGSFDANFSDAGALHVDDNGITNVGWEGGRSTAPFLYSSVPAGQDFTATVKIAAQTSGFWSAAGLIARASNSPTPPGSDADNADESFVTAYSFRTDAANPDSGNTLNKRIENGGQLADLNVDINPGTFPNPTPPPDTLPNPEPLPIWLKLERVGGVGYRTSVSTDGTTFQLQSHTIPTAGNALRDASVGMQVGLASMLFGGTYDDDMDPNTPEVPRPSTALFDDFVLDIHDPLSSPGAPNLPDSEISLLWRPGDPNISQVIEDSTMQGILQWTRVADPGNAGGNAGSTFGPGGLLPGTEPGLAATFSWNPSAAALGEYRWNITATNDWGESDVVSLHVTVAPEPASLALIALTVLGLAGGLFRQRKS